MSIRQKKKTPQKPNAYPISKEGHKISVDQNQLKVCDSALKYSICQCTNRNWCEIWTKIDSSAHLFLELPGKVLHNY